MAIKKLNKDKKRFIELAKHRDSIIKELSEINEEMEPLMTKIGLEEMFQDPDSKVIYKIHEPKGQYITFKKIDYKKTNSEGEKKSGSSVLSKSEAAENGFEV